MTITSIYPLETGRLYTIGELRAAEATLLAARQADKRLSDRLRVQDRKEIEWAKLRNEEWSPLMLLAGGLRLDDLDTFRWTPAGAADFVISSATRTLNVQCTMAYDEPEEAKYRSGHLHHLEMKHQRENGFYFGGGKISEPTARDVMEQLTTWRAGIVAAVEAKLAKTSYPGQQLDLLVYARGCSRNQPVSALARFAGSAEVILVGVGYTVLFCLRGGAADKVTSLRGKQGDFPEKQGDRIDDVWQST